MKICFIADANSIHARRWIEYFCKPDNEVYILSTTKNPKPIKEATIYDLSTPKSTHLCYNRRSNISGQHGIKRKIGKVVLERINDNRWIHGLRLFYRALMFKKTAKIIVEEVSPDLVHCLRLPIEGYIGGMIGYRPLIISTWGNDLVYFAQKYYTLRYLTKKALSITDVYFPDNNRDKYIAELYGYSPKSSSHPILATGGLKLEDFPLNFKDNSIREKFGIDLNTNLVISTRGFKNFYINTEALIKAIPLIVNVFPKTLFVVDGNVNSYGFQQLNKLAGNIGVEKYIRFTNKLNRLDLLNYLAASDIMVSVTLYDGWPISMLEGMAYGVIPIMSNHSPLQEWITDGWNGYLIDPLEPENIAQVIVRALENKNNFEAMRMRNWDILIERADYFKNMKLVEKMYHKVISNKSAQTC